MSNCNGKTPREAASFSIEMPLLPLLEAYCVRHDRNKSDAVNLAIKTLLAIEKSKDPDFWLSEYSKAEE